jgi:hypothetical protein
MSLLHEANCEYDLTGEVQATAGFNQLKTKQKLLCKTKQISFSKLWL